MKLYDFDSHDHSRAFFFSSSASTLVSRTLHIGIAGKSERKRFSDYVLNDLFRYLRAFHVPHILVFFSLSALFLSSFLYSTSLSIFYFIHFFQAFRPLRTFFSFRLFFNYPTKVTLTIRTHRLANIVYISYSSHTNEWTEPMKEVVDVDGREKELERE